MKTLQEIASELENEFQMGGLFDGIHKDFVSCVAKRYAHQALDLAAEKSQEMLYELKDVGVNPKGGLVIRDFQVAYAVPKQLILKLKEKI